MLPPDGVTRSLAHAAALASLPFQLAEELGLRCGYERSFKMLRGRLLANRYLLGINTPEATRDQWLDICRRLGMPAVYQTQFAAGLADANLIFLGFEDDETDCTYKVYLEFWEKVKAEVRNKDHPKEPLLLYLGFKWNADDNTQQAVSEYVCHPLLTVPEILARIAGIYAGCEDESCRRTVDEIVTLVARHCVAGSCKYVEVREGHSPRVSFDLNVYAAGARLSHVWPWLSRLRQHQGISSNRWDRLYDLVSDKLLGHISSGLDRRGEQFLTVYYEV